MFVPFKNHGKPNSVGAYRFLLATSIRCILVLDTVRVKKINRPSDPVLSGRTIHYYMGDDVFVRGARQY